jgi:hypothetical protein
MFEAPRRPLVFLAVVGENSDLIGKTGNTIKFMTATHLSATSISEANMNVTGMVAETISKHGCGSS